jgi:cytochrome c556
MVTQEGPTPQPDPAPTTSIYQNETIHEAIHGIREDVAQMKQDFGEMKSDVAEMKAEMKTDFAEMKTDIANVKTICGQIFLYLLEVYVLVSIPSCIKKPSDLYKS